MLCFVKLSCQTALFALIVSKISSSIRLSASELARSAATKEFALIHCKFSFLSLFSIVRSHRLVGWVEVRNPTSHFQLKTIQSYAIP
jgi:hypothetical protein